MPSPIGHALAGLTVALAADRPSPHSRSTAKLAVACALLAIAPDFDLVYPHGHRTMTHSFFAVGMVFIIALAITRQAGGPRWRLSLACALAYATHLLTDYFGADYGTPAGLQLFWPWSAEYFKSGVELFRTTERHEPLSWFAIRVNAAAAAQELLLLGPMVALAWRLHRRRRAGGR